MLVVEEEEAEFGRAVGGPDLGVGSIMRGFLDWEGEEEGTIFRGFVFRVYIVILL